MARDLFAEIGGNQSQPRDLFAEIGPKKEPPKTADSSSGSLIDALQAGLRLAPSGIGLGMGLTGWLDKRAASGEAEADAAKDEGFFDRTGSLLERGTQSGRRGIVDTVAGVTGKKSAQEYSQTLGRSANMDIAGDTSWEDVKADPSLGNIGSFVLNRGIESAPLMAAAAVPGVGMPIVAVSGTGNIARSRADADGREDVTGKDVAIAAPFGIGSAMLERFGIDKIIGANASRAIARVGQAAAAEGITETLQSGLEYTGGSVGTQRGFRLNELIDQSVAGGVAGAGMGGGIRTGIEVGSLPFRPVAPGKLEQSGAELSPDDVASPLDTDAIARGKQIITGQTAGKAVNEILLRNGMPRNGSRVSVTLPNGKVKIGTVTDAFDEVVEGEAATGVVIGFDDGTSMREHFDTLADAGVVVKGLTPTEEADAIDAQMRELATQAVNVPAAPAPQVDGAVAAPAAPSALVAPVAGKITSGFGQRKAPKKGASTSHGGIDYAVPVGTSVGSAGNGKVVAVGWDKKGGGNFVKIDHGNGVVTSYAHLKGATVKVGDEVTAGQQIALSGNTGNSTGPHLHFTVRVKGKAVDPLSVLGKELGGAAPAPVAQAASPTEAVMNPDRIEFDKGTTNLVNMDPAAPIERGQPIPVRTEAQTDTAVTANGRELPVRYGVVELADLKASNDLDGRANPNYPQALQPRDRNRGISQAQIAGIAGNLNPRLIGRSPKASDGAPIIGPDGVVESGNGRTLALQQAYLMGGDRIEAYKQMLADEGFDTTGMQQPVLVRVREGEMSDADVLAFTREANARDTLDMSATEQAMADANALGGGMLELYRGGDIDGGNNREFVRRFLGGVVASPNDFAKLIDSEGRMSQAAVARVRGAMLAKAYGNQQLVEQAIESTDTEVKSIISALTDVAGTWSKLREGVADGTVQADLDITENVNEAVGIVDRARREGKRVADLVNQRDIFSGKTVSPTTEAVLRLFFARPDFTRAVSRVRLAEALNFYAEEAMKAAPGGASLFGDLPKVEASGVLDLARVRQGNDEIDGRDLFAETGQPEAAEQRPAEPARQDAPEAGPDVGGRSGTVLPQDGGSEAQRDVSRAATDTTRPSPRRFIPDAQDILAVVDANNQVRNAKTPYQEREAFRQGAAVKLGLAGVEDEKSQAAESDHNEQYRAGMAAAEKELRRRTSAESSDRQSEIEQHRAATKVEPGQEAPPYEPAAAGQPVSLFAPVDEDVVPLTMSVEDFAEITDEWAALFADPGKDEIVRLADKVKAEGYLTPAQAAARIDDWEKRAQEQFDDPDIRMRNSSKTVLSLFDLSGEWSRPWEEAGYNVIRFDIQNDPELGDVNNFNVEFFTENYDISDVYAILAACPCTDFASSGARHFAAKDADGRTEASKELVFQTLRTIEYFRPAVWAIENPVGRIERLTGLPKARLTFDPNHLGDPYTKKTMLWGKFNADLPVAGVEPTEGSKMWKQYGGKSLATKNARSVTPRGFSNAFFVANNFEDMPIERRMEAQYPEASGAVKAALKAGVTPERIDELMEDTYGNYEYEDARNALAAEVASMQPTPPNGGGQGTTPDIDAAVAEVDTDPTDAQKEAGNYRKAHITVQGLDITIENPKGSERSGKDPNGKSWSVKMPAHYGYVKRSKGADGEQVDVYVGDQPEARSVFIIDQKHADTGKFDEHKVMLGFPDMETAEDTYRDGFSDGKGGQRLGGITEMSIDEFKSWLEEEQTKPVAEVATVKGEKPAKQDAMAKPLFSNKIDQGDIFDAPRADKAAVQEARDHIQNMLFRYASGMSRRRDLVAGAHGLGGSDKMGIGVDVGELSRAGMTDLAEAIIDWEARAFVDSGAFSLFKKQMKDGDVEALDFNKILDRYDMVLMAIDQADPAEKWQELPRGTLLLVMPDVVGDQAASLDLLSQYRRTILPWTRQKVARPIVPLQKGAMSLAEAYRAAVDNLGSDNFIVGIPSNEAAVSAEDVRTFVREARPKGLHFLGALSAKKLGPKMDALAEALAETGHRLNHLSADANLLRARLYGRQEGTRTEKITEAMTQADAAVGSRNERYSETLKPGQDVRGGSVDLVYYGAGGKTETRNLVPGAGKVDMTLGGKDDDVYTAADVSPLTQGQIDTIKRVEGDTTRQMEILDAIDRGLIRDGDMIAMGSPRWALESGFADIGPVDGTRRGRITEAGKKKLAELRGDKTPKPSPNKIVTDERAAELRARLKEKLNPNRVNSGIDPEILAIGTELAVYHIEKGARRFVAFAKAVAADLDMPVDALRKYLRGWYNGARDMMEDMGESVVSMDSADEVADAMRKFADWSTTPAETATAQPRNDDGLQNPISQGDARTSAADVQGAAPEGRAGSTPEPEIQAGTQPVRSTDGRSGKAAERTGARSERAADGGSPSLFDDAGLPDLFAGQPRPESPAPAAITGQNWFIEPGSLAESRGPAQKAADNVRAIEIVKELDAQGRKATAEEQAAISRYVGWGGLKNAFPDASGEYGKGFETIGPRLRELLTDDEYETARRSIQYAHYTSETIVRSMWDLAKQLGFKGGKIFEPGMGTGNFAGMMPRDVAAASSYHGLEYDKLTARIAYHLYPKWAVQQDDYTRTPQIKDAYDLVIGNPPFSETVIQSDPAYAGKGFVLHDYFFAKSLDAVRPGGLLMFVTSAGTMNKLKTSAREYMADMADLVGAIRLPGNAFAENAGTQVTTDIVVLRKRLPGEQPGSRDWVETDRDVMLPNRTGEMVPAAVNRYFQANPEMVLGEQGMFDKLVSGDRYAVRAPKGYDLAKNLQLAVSRFPAAIMSQPATVEDKAKQDFDVTATERKEGSFYIGADKRLMQMRGGVGVPVEKQGKGVTGGISAAAQERIKALIPVRDALRDVYRHDLAGDNAKASAARAQLNLWYDAFVKKFGPINKAEISYRRPSIVQLESARMEAREEARLAGREWDDGSFDVTPYIEAKAKITEIARARADAKADAIAAGREWNEGTFDPDDVPDLVIDKRPNIDPFMDDQESYRLRAIEHYNDDTGEAKKSNVFFENVITKEMAPEIRSANDALLYVMNRAGRPDIDEIARLAGKSKAEAIEELGDAVFLNHDGSGQYQTREQYLSGNVREKLALARQAAEADPAFERNVAALEIVQPMPLGPADIATNLGMPWIPADVIVDFAKDALGLSSFNAKYNARLAAWSVNGDVNSAQARTVWGTSDREAPFLIADALNRQQPKIYKEVRGPNGEKQRVLNAEATQAAQDKVNEIKAKFAEWIWTDQARTDRLVKLYNEQYNSLVAPEYDGSYLTTPGIASTWSWRPHQTRVVARIIQSGNTYMAHAVGAGKTSAMIGAGMEMRRLGLVRKPMYVVPNHMLGQFTKEFYEQYPTARIAVADERRFHTSRRKQFVANVAADDLDAVIITHSAFGYIPISEEFSDKLIQEQIDEYRDILGEIGKAQEDRFTRRRVEQQIEALEQRLSGRSNRKTDQVITFEEMGVDFLFVDEAHLFRKLDFSTKMGNVKGIDPAGSKMSFDLFSKVRYLESRNKGRSTVLASGTPITNTMAELFSLSRYLQLDELEKRQLSQFDAWASAFGDTSTALEQDPAGGYKSITRFAKFVNVPELSVMVRQVMDVVTPNDLEKYVTRPQLKGGKRQMVVVEQTDGQADYQEVLKGRMEAIQKRSGPPQKGDDILLSVIGDGRKSAIDYRLIDASAPKEQSKLETMIDSAFEIWKRTKRAPFHAITAGGFSAEPVDFGPATQMIFSDFGINGDFPVHKYIAAELARRGVPKNEIAIISDFKSHVARQRLFNDMNDGKVRFLIGSVAKMGTGVNAQKRLYALHNMDPQWYPANDEQRNGRIIRQGNMNPEVEIRDYSTKGTYDSQMWQLMETKARFIEGFMRGDPTLRDMDDLGEASQYEQAKAMTTSDPRIMRLTELKQDLEKAMRRRSAFDREITAIRNTIDQAKFTIDRQTQRVSQIEADIAQRQDISGDAFTGKVGGKEFDKRVEFGEAVLAKLDDIASEKSNATESKTFRIGEIGGFQLLGDAIFGDGAITARLFLQRNGELLTQITAIESASGLVSSIASKLRGFDDDLKSAQGKIENARATIEQFTPQLDRTFTGDAEIRELQDSVNKLEAELEKESKPVTAEVGALEGREAAEFINSLERPEEYPGLKESRVEPIAVLTGEEMGKLPKNEALRIKIMRDRALNWYRKNLAGKSAVGADGVEVVFGSAGMKKSTSHKGEDLLAALPALRSIIEKGAIRELPERRSEMKAFLYAGTVRLGGEDMRLAAIVRQDANGRRHYDLTKDTGKKSVGSPAGAVGAVASGPEMEVSSDAEINLFADEPVGNATEGKIFDELRARMAELGIQDAIALRVTDSMGARVAGNFDPVRRLITIALGSSQPRDISLNHEAVHAMRELGLFRDAEWQTLAKRAKSDYQLMRSVKRRYAELNEEAQIEEAVADMFAAWVRQKNQKGMAAKAFERVRDFFEALRNWARGNGWQSAGDVMRAMDAGAIGKRDIGEAQGGPVRNRVGGQLYGWSDKRIRDLLSTYGYGLGGDDVRTKAYAAFVSPRDFGKVTSTSSMAQRIKERSARLSHPNKPGTVNLKKLSEETQTPYLKVSLNDDGSWQVIGHEGRHRMMALAEAGVEAVPIAIVFERGQDLEIVDRPVTLRAQDYNYGGDMNWGVSQSDITIERAVPINEVNRDLLREEFGEQADVRFSKVDTMLSALSNSSPFKGRAADMFDRWRAASQDRYLPLLRTQQAIEKQLGRPLREGENPYLGEELMSGRIGAKLETLFDDMVDPLFEAMHKEGVDLDELETYLYARHAQERNERIASINPDFEEGTGSGMSDLEAQAILNRVDRSGRKEALDRVAALVDRIRDRSLRMRVDAGLMSEDDMKQWKSIYKHYVPLRGRIEVDGDADRMVERISRSGGGINVKGQESRRAFGRRSKADNILAYTLLQAEEAIVRSETNRVAQKFYVLAKNNPDPNFWATEKVTRKPMIDRDTGLVRYEDQTRLQPEDRDWTVTAKFDGEERRVTMNKDNAAARRLADAMRNLTQHQTDLFVHYLGIVNRFLSAVNTSYNPEFVVTNAFRDIQTAAVNLAGFDRDKLVASTLRDYKSALVASVKGAFKNESGEWGKWYREFVNEGGRVYFNQIDDLDTLKKRIEVSAKAASGGNRLSVKTMFFKVRDFVEASNNGVENAIRLAAYKNAREAGMSKAQAASLAKNLTVNFNRRGTFGPAMNAAYLFFNASVQGSARIITAMGSKRVRKIMAGVVVSGAMIELLNAMLSGDDDDGESYYDKISDFDKSRNLIIMLPGEGGRHIKIPLPYGYNAFFAIGRTAAEIMRRGGDRAMESASNLGTTIVDAFNPVGGSESLLNFISPTIIDPIVDLERNRDYSDRPILPEQNPYEPESPDAQRYFSSVGPHWRTITDFLTSATGGDDVVAGAIDVSPETLEHLAGVVIGAAGSFFDRNVSLVTKAFDSDEEIEANDLPFIRKMVGQKPGWYDKSAYYDRVNQIEKAISDAKDYAEREDWEKFDRYVDDKAKLIELEEPMKAAQKEMRAIRKARGENEFAYEMGKIDEATYKEERRVYKDAEKLVVSEFNTQWNAVMLAGQGE